MRRVLSVAIDADAETCGECDFRELYGRRWSCKLYREPVAFLFEEPQRLDACKAAERAAETNVKAGRGDV